jgi:hypothetical protein
MLGTATRRYATPPFTAARFSVTAPMNPAVKAAIASI